MQRCVIIGGAKINNYEFVRGQIHADDYIIYCDSGLAHREHLCLAPNLVIGDFDSHASVTGDFETIVLPCEKDDTDTVFAVKEALKRGFSVFILLGVVGERFDHSLANVALLLLLQNSSAKGYIVDDYSIMELVGKQPVYVEDDCRYFSLLAIAEVAEEVDITGAKYPLCHATITPSYQFGVSNEVLRGKSAKITVGKGQLLLLRIFHDALHE